MPFLVVHMDAIWSEFRVICGGTLSDVLLYPGRPRSLLERGSEMPRTVNGRSWGRRGPQRGLGLGEEGIRIPSPLRRGKVEKVGTNKESQSMEGCREGGKACRDGDRAHLSPTDPQTPTLGRCCVRCVILALRIYWGNQ